jgi:hypothetical protein
MSTTSNRMLLACAAAFVVSSTLVACGVFAALSRGADSGPDPSGSDRQAERAAMTVVRPYYAAIAEIGADGGARPHRIDRYVTDDHGSQLAVAFAGMRRDGWKTSGKTAVVDDELIGRRSLAHGGKVRVGVRVCLDVSGTRVIGPFGDDRTPPGRAERVPYDVWLTTNGAVTPHLRIESTTFRQDLTPC